MRTHVALLLAAAGSVSLGFVPQATLGAPVQVPLAPDMPEDAPGTGAPAPYAEVPLSTGDGNDEAVPAEAPVAQDQLPQPAVQQAPGRRMLGWLNPSRWWSPFRRGARSAVSEPEQAVGGPGVVGGTTSPSEEQVMGQPEGLRNDGAVWCRKLPYGTQASGKLSNSFETLIKYLRKPDFNPWDAGFPGPSVRCRSEAADVLKS
ncbi:hypothetical protein NCLIV_004230 [Neospora caninum Liverpool]|uniref:Uncharacterized protein n=1 Tax=Neospora caninum (strain Liverpool) TaxID=572307 RepID=F0V898_NEOCL|nr:hypothetical protein NCLIV_004230 [Neospora caninum Liverpool]CBZ49939.1 hypothetical protein NCLIV_004230 [Neospora caninum Liverpool]|eukprot:XP_003879974.1 hypothetical protein NCLIV_004230 [Neospora caninum Liverpool]